MFNQKNMWRWWFGLFLVILSSLIYLAHYFTFKDPHHIFIFFISDIAFIPIEVLIVTLIIHKLLNQREKKTLFHRLNMVIGVFFNQTGSVMFEHMKPLMVNPTALEKRLTGMTGWTVAHYNRAITQIDNTKIEFDCVGKDLRPLRDALTSQHNLLLRLLENPNLLGHDRLTEMLWAVTHLHDELTIRPEVDNLGPGVGRHISTDLGRAYRLLVSEWLAYMAHLKVDYPYMYLTALKNGPFGLVHAAPGGAKITEQEKKEVA